MAKGVFLGAGGVKSSKKIWVGAGGVKKVKKIFAGIGGVVKVVYSTGIERVYPAIEPLGGTANNSAHNPSYAMFSSPNMGNGNLAVYNNTLVKSTIMHTITSSVRGGCNFREYAVLQYNPTEGPNDSLRLNFINQSLVNTLKTFSAYLGVVPPVSNSEFVNIIRGQNGNYSGWAFDKNLAMVTGVTHGNNGISDGSYVSTDNYMVYAGGYYGGSSSKIMSFVDTSLVKTTGELDVGIYMSAGAKAGNSILIAGGRKYVNSGAYQRQNIVYAFNYSTLVKSTATPLKGYIESMEGASLDEYGIFLGGYNGSGQWVRDIHIYDGNLVQSYMNDAQSGSFVRSAVVGSYALFSRQGSTSLDIFEV